MANIYGYLLPGYCIVSRFEHVLLKNWLQKGIAQHFKEGERPMRTGQ